MKSLPTGILLIVIGLFGLSGCNMMSVSIATTKFNLTVHTSQTINPSDDGSSSPVVLTAYELKSNSRFESSDFYSLYSRPAETLSPDLLGQQSLNLVADRSVTTVHDLHPDTRYIGVVVAFRDIDRASWRLLIPVEPESVNQAEVKIEDNNAQLIAH